ncbi:MAG: hypothetical protein AAFT19_09615, partial [Pseudomonadota bacterium]
MTAAGIEQGTGPKTEDPSTFDALLLLIGRLNYTWTNTESLLIHLIAGLSGTDKETAVVIFLTLNTTRARLDLVERLAKMERVSAEEREPVLAATARMQGLAALRNRYNHCIYSFDEESGGISTILMRIADRKDHIKIGKTTRIDEAAIREIEDTIAEMT